MRSGFGSHLGSRVKIDLFLVVKRMKVNVRKWCDLCHMSDLITLRDMRYPNHMTEHGYSYSKYDLFLNLTKSFWSLNLNNNNSVNVIIWEIFVCKPYFEN